MKLTGFEAIDYAEWAGLPLNKSATSDPASHGLTIAEAEAIAVEHPRRVWLMVPDGGLLVAAHERLPAPTHSKGDDH